MGTVNNMQIQDDEGNIYHPETTIKQIIDESGNQMFPGGKPGNMDSREMAVTFEEAKTRENIESGEKHGVIFGKIKKFLTDLKTVAFSGKYGDLSERPSLGGASALGVANNCTTTEAGFALDARQGKTLMDKSNELSRELNMMERSGDSHNFSDHIKAWITTASVPFGRSPKSFNFHSHDYVMSMSGIVIQATSGFFNGFFTDLTTGDFYAFSLWEAGGADPIIKKLGSGFLISNYVFNYRVNGSGNGSSSGSQGRSGESRFVLDTKEYDTLTIGSYIIEGDGDHAAWNPNDAVALKIVINGSTKTVSKGGGIFDVSSADSVTISATFNTNSNKDYGTWATLTVSSIKCE